MDKKQLNALLPLNKADTDRAKHIAAMDYASVKPVAFEMLRWVRTYRTGGESPVADVFIEFFIHNADAAGEEVEKALRTSKLDSWKYVIVTQILPEWPRSAIDGIKESLTMLVTDSSNPETALMALQLLAKHNLGDKDWLRLWLDFISERMERNLREAHQIADTYFE